MSSHRHAGVAQHPALRERLVCPQQACGTRRGLDLADLDGSCAAQKGAHKLGCLRPGRVEAPRLPRPEFARAQRMILRFKGNPRRALALLRCMSVDAERERSGVGRKLVLHLQQQAPLLVGRIRLDQEGGTRGPIRERVEESRMCASVAARGLHDRQDRNVTHLRRCGELIEQRAGGASCVTSGWEIERIDDDDAQILDCLNRRIEQRQVGGEIKTPRPVRPRYVAQDLHAREIRTGRLEPWHQHIGIAVRTDQDHRAFWRAAFAAGIGSAGSHCGDDVDRERGLAARWCAGEQRELGVGNAARRSDEL